jgi:pilus assembly protein Flp/PilA
MRFTKRLWSDEQGATAIEYGLLAALISVAIIVAVVAVGDQLFNTFDAVQVELGGTTVAP